MENIKTAVLMRPATLTRIMHMNTVPFIYVSLKVVFNYIIGYIVR